MEKKIYFCRKCGRIHWKLRKPKRCSDCKNKTFGRILTEDDLKHLKK